MKLINCHVENFGKLQDFYMNFEEGTNQICQENGWGKSTLAAFIRAMFYGLEGERKRSIEENERKRYKPWQGGAFGGSLTFEVGGTQYTVSRIFHEKEAQDEFELRETKKNLISKDFSAKLGEELFHINRESFMRTVFIGQSECETDVTDDINAQIGNLTDNTKDLNNFEAANARLTELINSITPNRVTGSLAKRAGEITKLERIVADGKQIGESLDTYREYLQEEQVYYEQLKEQLDTVCEQQAKVSALQVALAKKEEWSRIKSTRDNRAVELQRIRDKFPKDVPSMKEIDEALGKALSLEKLSERVALYSLEELEKSEWEELQEPFRNGLPVQEEVAEVLESAKQLRALRQQQAEVRLSEAEMFRLDDLEKVFAKEENDVSFAISEWNECMKRKAALPSKQAALAALQASKEWEERQKKSAKGLAVAGITTGFLVMLAGILAAVLWEKIWGIAAVMVGVILLAVGMIALRKAGTKMNSEVLYEIEALKKKIAEDERFVQETEAFVYEYLDHYATLIGDDRGPNFSEMSGKIFSEAEVFDILQEISAKYYEYTDLKKKLARQSLNDKTEEMEVLRDKISSYLKQYGIVFSEENMSENMHELKNKALRYRSLKEKKRQGTLACEEYANVMQNICAFLKKYNYFPENDFRKQLSEIKNNIDAYLDAEKWLQESLSVLNEFEEANHKFIAAEDIPEMESTTLEELNQTVQKLTEYMEKSHNAIVDYNRRLEDMQEQYDDWEENKLYLDELKMQQEKEKKKFGHLTKAKVYLGLAKESITAKYAAPIFQSFCHYFEIITKNSAQKYRIDANTTLTVEESGKQREINTLSAGYRDLVGICLRVALVDAMYAVELPMLIMDDPFTNLDDEKAAAAMAFLQEIGKKYQVIYFTCSKGRCGSTEYDGA